MLRSSANSVFTVKHFNDSVQGNLLMRGATKANPHPPAPAPIKGEGEPESFRVPLSLWERDLGWGGSRKLPIAFNPISWIRIPPPQGIFSNLRILISNLLLTGLVYAMKTSLILRYLAYNLEQKTSGKHLAPKSAEISMGWNCCSIRFPPLN